jgi:hypothetical protein
VLESFVLTLSVAKPKPCAFALLICKEASICSAKKGGKMVSLDSTELQCQA